MKRLRTKRTRAFTSFNNAAVNGTTGAGGDATLLACEQALQLLTLSTNTLADTMGDMIARFSSSGSGAEKSKLMPANQEGMEKNMVEITGDLNKSELEMGAIRAHSEDKKEKAREEERAERVAATKTLEAAKETERLQKLADIEAARKEVLRLEARDDKREDLRRADKEREDLARIEEREHRDSKVKPVDALKPSHKGHLKLSAPEIEDFIQAARVWAEQSRFHLATAVTQQQYF